MANKLYKESDVARIAGKINSYTGEGKAYKLGEMADGVDEAAEAAAEEKEAVTIALIERIVTEFDIPEGTKVIGNGAFSYWPGLERLSIPSTVVELKDNAIKSCTLLREIVLPDGLQKIGSASINGCGTIAELIIPSGVVSFPNWAISGNPSLLRIKFLGAVSSISQNSFASNARLSEYDFGNCTRVPTLAATNAISTRENTKIYVPFALYDSWIEATNWSQFKDYIVPVYDAPEIVDPGYVSEGLEYEFVSPFYRVIGRGSCTDTVIVIPETYDDGEHGERRVTNITGKTNVDSIPTEGAFQNDKTIEEIILPETGVTFRYDTFRGSSLKIIRNYSGGDSFWSFSLALEYVSIIDGTDIVGYDFSDNTSGVTLDFSRHTSVPELSDVSYINAHEGLKILVPLDLYDEWVSEDSTNWVALKEYIFPAK